MESGVEIIKQNKETYSQNFLEHIIFRIDLAEDADFTGDNLTKFKNAIKDVLTITEHEERKGFLLKVESGISSYTEHLDVLHKFFDDKKKWKLTLVPGLQPAIQPSLIFEFFSSYSTPQKLVESINSILVEFMSIYGDIITKRAGLRYTYIIKIPKGNPFDWENLITDELIPPITLINKNEVTRLVSSIEVNKDEHMLRFQYGLFNSEYPNTIAKKEFTLDYDCYTHDKKEISSMVQLITIFDKEIWSLFEASIKEDLRMIMRGVK